MATKIVRPSGAMSTSRYRSRALKYSSVGPLAASPASFSFTRYTVPRMSPVTSTDLAHPGIPPVLAV